MKNAVKSQISSWIQLFVPVKLQLTLHLQSWRLFISWKAARRSPSFMPEFKTEVVLRWEMSRHNHFAQCLKGFSVFKQKSAVDPEGLLHVCSGIHEVFY